MGRIPLSLKQRFEILKRDNFTCYYCKKTDSEEELEVDHIVPVKLGGETVPENLVTSCKKCNRGKGARPLTSSFLDNSDFKPRNADASTADYKIEKNVKPIKNTEQINHMKECLINYCSKRDYMLFVVGINTGLRAGDLLNLKITDVKGKYEVKIRENKTDKYTKIYLTNFFEELNDYISELQQGKKVTEWLFPSRKGDKPITVTQAYRQLNKAAEYAQIEHVGTETMRKTFGYWFYKQTNDIATLQKIYNNSSTTATLDYIGIGDDDCEHNLKSFKL